MKKSNYNLSMMRQRILKNSMDNISSLYTDTTLKFKNYWELNLADVELVVDDEIEIHEDDEDDNQAESSYQDKMKVMVANYSCKRSIIKF